MNEKLVMLSQKLLTKEHFNQIMNLDKNSANVFNEIINIDRQIGGIGVYNINSGNTGRYNVYDRDILRPFQYLYRYFQMDADDIDWLTREIIHLSGLHLESLVKRLLGIEKLPLGKALTMKLARIKLGKGLINEIRVIVNLYNDSKHNVSHEKDTHLFDYHTSVLCYFTTRILAMKLIPKVKLYTDPRVWIDDNSIGITDYLNIVEIQEI